MHSMQSTPILAEMEGSSTTHVLFLARWYPNRNDAMLGLFVKRHAEAAALFNKISVVFAEPHLAEGKGIEIDISRESNMLTIGVYYPSLNSTTAFNRLVNNIRYFRAINKGLKIALKENGKPKLIHVHILTRLAIPALFYKFFHRIPYVITEHWSRYLSTRNEFKGFFRRRLTQLVVNQAAMLTTVTKDLRKAMRDHGLHNWNTVILPNVVDMDLFKIKEKVSREKVRIVHVSCFEDRSKNIFGIINVITQLKNHTSNFECVMIGDGMNFHDAVHLAETKGLSDSEIHFTGLLEGQALAHEIASSDFMLLFSNYENMPVVILEAFACGLPVVATNVGGIPEMINKENGLLVEKANESQLLNAITKMMQQYRQYDPQKIRASVMSVYGKQAVGKQLTKWYHQIISGKSIDSLES